jgi:hypothetical protein
MQYDLSVIIPARNEEFLNRTIQDILEHKRGKTQIIVGLDGQWPAEPIESHPDVVVLYYPESIGQRAISNQCAKLSRAKFLMKLDAHVAVDEGFDIKMLEAFERVGENVVIAPIMRNLHVFNYVCPNGHSRYQSPSGPCKDCGKDTVKDVVWIPKTNPQSTAYCFDPEPHFQYMNKLKERQSYKDQGDLTESMSLQGSCFMMTKDKYFELNIDDETLGSWGSQGLTVACKFWLSGGRVLINHNTWYAHMFRTQGGDFGFPYDQPGKGVEKAKKMAKEMFFNDKLIPLVEKFWPIPGWSQEDLDQLKGTKAPTRGVLYYTDNQLPMELANLCRKYIKRSNLPVTSVSMKKTPFGRNLVVPGVRGKLQMFKQILTGLEAMTEDIVFFTEADVVYHRSHFNFYPPTKDKFYYNENNWRVRREDRHAVYFDHDSLSQMCCYRELALQEFRKLVAEQEVRETRGGFEPGTRDGRSARWRSEYPNLDIRHDHNLTQNRWSPTQFRDKSTCTNWQEGTIDTIANGEWAGKI